MLVYASTERAEHRPGRIHSGIDGSRFPGPDSITASEYRRNWRGMSYPYCTRANSQPVLNIRVHCVHPQAELASKVGREGRGIVLTCP